MFAALQTTLRRARQERLLHAAGSLAFTTLLALAPLLAVALALFSRWPGWFDRFAAALDEHLFKALLPPEIARAVLRQLHRFAANADELGWGGSLFLVAAAMALMLTVENTLNQMWNVRTPRPLARRLALYVAMLALGPPLLGVSLWTSAWLLGASLGWFGPLPPSAAFVLQLGPAALTFCALAALYGWVPHTRVRIGSALVGAAVATAALELGKRGFAAYLLEVPTYKTLYGVFAVLPLFMLWVWYSWLVTLGAALLASNLFRGGR
jgi:membrane protein